MADHGQVKGGGPRERGRPSNLATGADARGPTDPEQLQITERGIKGSQVHRVLQKDKPRTSDGWPGFEPGSAMTRPIDNGSAETS